MWIDEFNNKVMPKSKINYEIIGIEVNGREYLPGDDGQLCVYINDLKGFTADKLPPNLVIIPAVQFNADFINQGNFQGDIVYDGEKLLCIVEFEIEPNGYNDKFNDEDLNIFYKIKNTVKNLGYSIEDFYDGDDYKNIILSFSMAANIDVGDALKEMEHIANSIIGYIPNEFSFTDIDEESFTKLYVIPALQKLGMINVRYTHGIEEYGRDIVYQYYDNFKKMRYGSVQVKSGNISGNAKGKLTEIIEQIGDSFSMPYKDISKRQEVNIEQVAIVCSGRYTNNAQNKILNKMLDGRYVVFFDGQDIKNMIQNNIG